MSQITYRVKSPLSGKNIARTSDFIIWYAKSKKDMKTRNLKIEKKLKRHPEFSHAIDRNGNIYTRSEIERNEISDVRYFTAQTVASTGYTASCIYSYEVCGKVYKNPRGRSWKTHYEGMERLEESR